MLDSQYEELGLLLFTVLFFFKHKTCFKYKVKHCFFSSPTSALSPSRPLAVGHRNVDHVILLEGMRYDVWLAQLVNAPTQMHVQSCTVEVQLHSRADIA